MRKSIHFLFLFLFSFYGNAQEHGAMQEFGVIHGFSHYGVDEGLPQSEVNAIYEDSRGFIWFATQGGGVARFDGQNFVAYDQQSGLNGQLVTSIAEDQNGNMWFGSTWGGVSCFNGRYFKAYTASDGIGRDHVNTVVFEAKANRIWVGTEVGVSYFDGSKFNLYVDKSGEIPEIKVECSYYTKEGELSFGLERGFIVMRDDVFHLMEGTQGLKITDIAADEAHYWLASDIGLLCIDRKTGEQKALPALLQMFYGNQRVEVNAVFASEDGSIWIGTAANGIYQFTKDHLNWYNQSNGFTTTQVKCIYEDSHRKIWIGADNGGVFRFNGNMFKYFNGTPGLGEQDVFSIAEDHLHRIWVASASKGVFCYDGIKVQAYTQKDGLPDGNPRYIFISSKHEIWVGTTGGVAKWNGSGFRSYTEKDGLPLNNVRCIAEDKEGNLWFGTSGKGVAIFDGQHFQKLDDQKGLNHNFVHSLFCSSRGVMYIGTGAGLNTYDKGVVSSFGEQHGLCNSYVGSITEDKQGGIWVGTDKCVARFNGRRFENFGIAEGLESGTIYLLTTDNNGDIIAGTNKGFERLKLSTYGQVSRIEHYSVSEGFLGAECNSKAVLVDHLGRIWFGTIKGVIRYDQKEEMDEDIHPRVHISSVKLFYDTEWLKELDNAGLDFFSVPESGMFRHDQNNLTFNFIGICLEGPKHIRYSFFLEGFDKGWSKYSFSPTVSYSNLPPGEYVFHVRAINRKGNKSEDATFAFTISPAFYQTWWFVVLVLVVMVYGIYYVNTLLQRNVMRYNVLLEEKVNNRTREIMKQKEDKEILLKEIHHRVKNNMQVIVSLLNIHADYIKDPESLALLEDSKSRIKSMALIHEKLYETRNFARVNISEYLDSLVDDLVDTYGVDTEVVLDKKIEADSFGFDTIIPLGLLLNEIVSNSLKYAFQGRKEGKIHFHLQPEGKRFVLLIGDDGIGLNRELFDNPGKTLGVDLIRILVEQLNGTIELLDGPGTNFRIVFESIDKRRI